MFTPTKEQSHAVALSKTGASLALEAMAGTGKSSTLKLIANAMPNKRMLYTAFSASVIADAKQGGFPRHVSVKTNHGLAFASFGRAFMDAGRMQRRLTPKVVVDALGLAEQSLSLPGDATATEAAHYTLGAINSFQQSADTEIRPAHVKLPLSVRDPGRQELGRYVLRLATRLWSMMIDKHADIPVQHDTYFKLWALSKPELPYDVTLLDEAQDANAVMIGVLKRFQGQLIIVGDQAQQIFSWRGAQNAMRHFDVEERAALTQSFRFGPKVAQAANAVLFGHQVLKPGIHDGVKGTKEVASVIGDVDTRKQYTLVARKNMTLVEEIVNAKGRVGVVGGVADLLKLVDGAELLQAGRKPLNCPDLVDFSDWKEVEEYAERPAGRDLMVLVTLVKKLGTWRLKELLKQVDGNERHEASCDVLLSTAHKSKGREWDQVILADDFPTPTDQDLGLAPPEGGDEIKESKWNPEEANLLYVAVTRAKKVLQVAGCGAWLDAVRRSDPEDEGKLQQILQAPTQSKSAEPRGSFGAEGELSAREVIIGLLDLLSGNGAREAITDAEHWLIRNSL